MPAPDEVVPMVRLHGSGGPDRRGGGSVILNQKAKFLGSAFWLTAWPSRRNSTTKWR
jgi:hypothetical protein